MADVKRRLGRPKSRLEDGPGDFYVGFRSPRKLKAQLVEAAAAANRSISTETQVRLESTFRDENALDLAMDLAFGPQLAAVTMLLARIMQKASDWADAASGRVPGEGGWLCDPYAFAQVQQAVDRVFTVLRPPGEAVVPPLPDYADVLGERVANVLLAAAAGEAEEPGSLKTWGDRTYDRLGAQIAARITKKLDEDLAAPAAAPVAA